MTATVLTFSHITVSSLGRLIPSQTLIAHVARRPDLVQMLHTELMLTTTAANTAHKPDHPPTT